MHGSNHRLFKALAAFAGLLLFVLAILALAREIRSVSLAEIAAQFSAIPAGYFALAALFTLASYLLLTGYDCLAFKYLGEKVSYRSIAPVAFSAFAIGNNVGVASLSGGAVRYRAYSAAGLTTTQIAAIIAFIPFTFFLGALALIGAALVLEPARALSSIHLQVSTLRIVGIFLLVLPLLYVALAGLFHGQLRLAHWSIKLPSLRVRFFQLLLASLDLVVTSLVLFVLISSATDVHYLVFLGAFLLALVLGVISTVPGAIGIFESSMVLLLPEVPAPVLLGAMVAYRLIYYLLPLLIAVGLIVTREVLAHKNRLQKLSGTGIRWTAKLVPQAIGTAIFIAGAYLLARGALPAGLGESRLVQAIVPLPLLEMSHLFSSAIGAGLLLVARGLYRRLHRALLVTLVLLAASVVTSLLQFHGLPQVAFLLTLLLLTWLSRAEFYRGRRLLDQPFDSRWIANLLLILAAMIGLGFFAHKNVAYSQQLWWQFTLDGDASRMLRAALLALLTVGMFGFGRLLRGASSPQVKPDEDALRRVQQLVQISPSSSANIALLGDKRFLFHPSGEAFVMYQASGGSWIALGDPVGNPAKFEELLWLYREACDANNARCVFYQISEAFLPLYIDLGLSFLKLGEEAVVDLTTFDLEGSRRAEFRQAIKRAQRNGAEFSIIPASEVGSVMEQLAHVSSSWLQGKAAVEKGFSLGFFAPAYISNFDCAVVKVAGEIVAFANLWKGADGNELSIDLMRYTDNAPKVIMDYLFAEIMLWGKANAFRRFNLGMAPLAGLEKHTLAPLWHKFGNLIYRFGEHFYNFEGLRHYKSKFEPAWEPRFLACKGGLQVSAVLLDTTALIGGGVKGLLFK